MKKQLKRLDLRLGALAPSIAEQLREQKFKFSTKVANGFNELDVCAARLYFAGLITHSDRIRVTNKIFKAVKKHVEDYGQTRKRD